MYSGTQIPITRKLTPREAKLRLLLLSSRSTDEIASALGVSRNSLKVIASRLYTKLHIGGRVELMGREIYRWRTAAVRVKRSERHRVLFKVAPEPIFVNARQAIASMRHAQRSSGL